MTSNLIVGIDEVGRGPLAGPVVAAAVALDPASPVAGLMDSKKLTPKKRLELDKMIKSSALGWAVGEASVQEIDQINILQASLLAMQRAVAALPFVPSHAKVDGNTKPKLPCTCEAIIGGDATEPEISAASIIAKVFRDALLVNYEAEYPGYGFAQHKGYGTRQHREALKSLGPTPIHRQSFAPVAILLKAAEGA